MREALKDPGRLEHILAAIRQIDENRLKYSNEEILGNTIVFYGFTKLLEIIGEAVYMLTKDFKSMHPEINWSQIEGMRHVLVHGYYTIEPITVLNTITKDLPKFKVQVEDLLESL